MVEVDARGLSCPEPAMQADSAMKMYPSDEIHVLVSSNTAKVNVLEVAKRHKREATAERDGDDYVIIVK